VSDTSDVVERAVAELIDLHRGDCITLTGAVLDLVHIVEPDFQPDPPERGGNPWRVM
jgi:hypothetical protein